MFDHIVRIDQRLLLLNTLHLMFIAFLPFPTAVLARALHDGVNEPLATAFYGGTLTLIGALVTIMPHMDTGSSARTSLVRKPNGVVGGFSLAPSVTPSPRWLPSSRLGYR